MSFEDLPDLVSDSDDDDFVVPPRDDVRTPRNPEALHGSWEARLVGWDASSALNYLTSKTRVQGSPHEVEFRAKFGVNRLVYDRILQELRVCHVNWAREGNRHKVFQWLKRQEGLPETDNGCPWWPRVVFKAAHLQPNGRGQYQLVPAALKLLGALAYLKTGASVRAISTEYGMGYNTLNTFVSNFVVWAGDRLNDEPTRAFVPGWEFSVEDAEEVYSRLGFPGAMGCMDVIHVAWNNCPAPDRAAFTGKEGFPTIALNVVSGPRRSCTFIGDAQPGARNDKAICKICPSVASLRQDKTLQWQLETPGGVLQMTGAYVLVDGGYVKYAQLMAPYKTTTDAAKALWSKRFAPAHTQVKWPQRQQSRDVFRNLKSTGHLC
ncbi:DDE Tnp4 domain-containing protein [Pseudoscourfieldia marina]